jgi:predicted P-loop ATPase
MMRDAVHLVADQQKMDSAALWLEKLKWDGTPRIERFCPDYFGTEDTAYTQRVGAYIWTALAGRILSPGCQADMVPVLVGRQGVGKSRDVQAMAPALEHFAELRIDDPDDTIARKMRGCLVAELAEMRGMRAADIERIKAFITRTHEHWVPKYKEFAITYPRRFIMIGTTNDEEFLPQDTEHRRWLPLTTREVNVGAIKAHRDQLWAEGAVRYALEGIAWQGLDRLAAPARETAANMDIWTETVDTWARAQSDAPYIRLEDVMTHALGMDPRMITRPYELRAARVLRSLGYAKTNRRHNGLVVKVWTLDPLS